MAEAEEDHHAQPQEEDHHILPGSALSADDAWGLAPMESKPGEAMPRTMAEAANQEEFKSLTTGAMKKMCEMHGGFAQYLRAQYGTKHARAAFSKKLYVEFPFAERVAYHVNEVIPSV